MQTALVVPVVGMVMRADGVAECMDRAKALLKGRGAHGGGTHHVGACLDIGAVGIGAWQVVLTSRIPSSAIPWLIGW